MIEGSKGSLDKLNATLTLIAPKNMTIEKQYVACAILLLDPANERARSLSGLSRVQIPAPIR